MARNQFVRIEGLREALRKIDGVTDAPKQARAAVVEAAGIVQKSIQARTPVLTGNLRRSIKSAKRPPFIKGRDEDLRQIVYADAKVAPHSHLVEFGHGGPHPAPPHPYFRPGVIESRGRVEAIITNGLRKAFKL